MRKDIEPFKKKIWLASPYIHENSRIYMRQAFDTNWMSTIGDILNQLEKGICRLRHRQ